MKTSDDKPSFWLILLFLVICAALAVAHAECVYDDPSCAFAKCVKVKP